MSHILNSQILLCKILITDESYALITNIIMQNINNRLVVYFNHKYYNAKY